MPATLMSLISGSPGRPGRSRLQVLLRLLAVSAAAVCAILAGSLGVCIPRLEISFVTGAQGQHRTAGRTNLARASESQGLPSVTGSDDGMLPVRRRVFLVTGSTDGIGKFTAEKLLRRGCIVLFHGRGEEERMQEQLQQYGDRKEYPGELDAFLADLSEPEEVESLAELILSRHPRIDGILHNAATIDGDFTGRRKLTFGNKNEHTISTNTLAPFLLTAKLMPALKRAQNARVIFSGSEVFGSAEEYLNDLACETKWTGLHAYKLSKLCSEMMVQEMHHRYGDAPQLCFHSIDPGTVDTKLMRQGSYYGTGHKKGRGYRGTFEDLERSGSHRLFPHVRTATASYEALVADRFQRCSGCMVPNAPPVVRDEIERRKLWDQLVTMTNADWPSASNVETRQITQDAASKVETPELQQAMLGGR